jgi:HSP90 family molecular chaperone
MLKKYARMLYVQAMLTEGFEIDDMGEYFTLVTELMVK